MRHPTGRAMVRPDLVVASGLVIVLIGTAVHGGGSGIPAFGFRDPVIALRAGMGFGGMSRRARRCKGCRMGCRMGRGPRRLSVVALRLRRRGRAGANECCR